MRRQVDAAREHERQRGAQHRAARRLGDVARGAGRDRAARIVRVLGRGEDHHGEGRAGALQPGQAGPAVGARHVEIEQHEVEIRVRLRERESFRAVRRLEQLGVLLELMEGVEHSLAE